MIRSLFINKEALEKGANRPEAADQQVKKLGVMGAGMMGAGIALVSAQAGIEVVLIDQNRRPPTRARPTPPTTWTRASARQESTEDKKDACWT